MTKQNQVGSDPSQVPQEGHGGDNTRGADKTQGKEGNGAQKRQQKKS